MADPLEMALLVLSSAPGPRPLKMSPVKHLAAGVNNK
jgi:hypothetical protein